MGTFLILFLLACLAFWLIKMYTSNKLVANDDFFEQAGVRVDFKEETIKIGKYVYPVDKVTGISTVTQSGGRGLGDAVRSTVGTVEISVDDFKKPIHRIAVNGGSNKAPEFSQRLCVAIRKANGPSFS